MEVASQPSLLSFRRRNERGDGSIDEIAPAGNRRTPTRVVPAGSPIYVRGWALDRRASELAGEVRLLVDGVREIPTAYGHMRADIANAFGQPALGRCGFEAIVPPELGIGDHALAACAVDVNRREYVTVAETTLHVIPALVPRPFSDEVDAWALGQIESFATDDDVRTAQQRAGRFEALVGGGIVVNGWAFDRAALQTFSEIGAVVDDRWYLPGIAGRPRDDVARSHGLPQIADCGYWIRFVLNFVEPGPHALRIVAKRPDGVLVHAGEVTFEALAPPLPWIWALPELRQRTRARIEALEFFAVRPKRAPRKRASELPSVPRGNGIFVEGWAVDDPLRTPAVSVYVSIDGDRREPIPGRSGLPATALPSPCGFTALVPTDDLKPGSHTLELLVVACNWNGYYAPLPPLTFEVVGDDDDDDDEQGDGPRVRSSRGTPRRPEDGELELVRYEVPG